VNEDRALANRALGHFIELIEIPQHYYELACKRYESLADWFHREGGSVARFNPGVSPQGSFRLGTVIRPLTPDEEYDLDLVVALRALAKSDLSQATLKEVVGEEVSGYAKANGIRKPVREKKRCWRLDYADEVCFHMDILPAIPDDEVFVRSLIRLGIPESQATHALAITDLRHPSYQVVSEDWPRSNPKGYASWFEGRMEVVARRQRVALVEKRLYASVDEVPVFALKTPLQRAIQILKRHRDVMFRDKPTLKPISMIISTLSAMAYGGETDLYSAITNILSGMPELIRPACPRIPNPVNPAEDFADKWQSDPRLEQCFWDWHTQASADFTALSNCDDVEDLLKLAGRRFDLTLTEDRGRGLIGSCPASSHSRSVPPVVAVSSAPAPWARDA